MWRRLSKVQAFPFFLASSILHLWGWFLKMTQCVHLHWYSFSMLLNAVYLTRIDTCLKLLAMREYRSIRFGKNNGRKNRLYNHNERFIRNTQDDKSLK